VSERSLYSMRSFILSQCRDLRMGVIWEDLGALTTVRARQFWMDLTTQNVKWTGMSQWIWQFDSLSVYYPLSILDKKAVL